VSNTHTPAAPGLLEALNALVQQVEERFFDDVSAEHPNSAVIQARAAIAAARRLTPMQTLTAAIKAGERPNATDTAAMLYELAAAFGNNWPESEWMNSNPETWADEIITAQECMNEPSVGLFEMPAFPSIRRAA